MTTAAILMSCVGYILCAFIFCTICILILGIVWYVFKTDMDVEIESERWEDEL